MDRSADQLAVVRKELEKYSHPLLSFDVRRTDAGRIELVIDLKEKAANIHTYYLEIHPRDLHHSQFRWILQRMICEGLHDYFVEMFEYTPQSTDNPAGPYELQR